MIFHLSQDLVLVGKVSSTARTAGVEYQSYSRVDRLLESIAPSPNRGGPSGCVFVDLQLPGLPIEELVRQLREFGPRLQVIAYAQHVKRELLEQARAAGPDQVLTRGQFDQQVVRLVQSAAPENRD